MKNLFKVLMVVTLVSLSAFGNLNAGKPTKATTMATSAKSKLKCINCSGDLDASGNCQACSAQ